MHPANQAPAQTRSTCPYCGVGCGVIIESQGTQITGVRGDPDHPANFGKLCSKGSTLHLTASAEVTRQTRLLQPLQRMDRGGATSPITWDSALDLAADRFHKTIAEHGPDAVGFYISGQLLTEDYYVFNKLSKGLIGTNNIDTNSRLCMSSAVAGYKLTLGADAPPASYEDIDHAACLFIAGSNAAFAHPVLFRRIEEARQRNPAMKMIVADPRRTDTAEQADLFLQLQPGSDVMLFHGLLHIMLWEGWTDTAFMAAHTTGFDELKALVRDCTPERVAQVCGLKKEDLFTAAKWFAGLSGQGFAGMQDGGARQPTLSLYCQGLNQSSSGTAKNATLINLHLATGQIGKPGAGPFSLTGQPNAMGGREVGGLANLLSAHRDMGNAQHRAEVAALWGVADVPSKPGKTAVEMFQAAADGEIKALWIACTNPAQSMPDQALVRRALERCEFVVVQEAFATASTCDFADLLLPATTWGEKEGTVTNSERRISRVRAAVPAPGAARHDWQIVVNFANRLEAKRAMGVRSEFRTATPKDGESVERNSALTPMAPPAETTNPNASTLFPYTAPEQIWNEHRASTRGRDLDITGLSYTLLEAQGPQQWPFRDGDSQGKTRLYDDGRFPTPDQKARFAALPFTPLAEPRESRYPFSLTTGRLRDQWHGMTRTGTLGRLFGHVPEPVIQLHPQDMERRGLKAGDLVQVTSKRGSIVLPLQASTSLGLTQAFIAMHWGAETLSGRSSTGTVLAGVNALTTSAFCPTSKQPELKHAAVKVLKAELPWTLLAMAWLPDTSALSTLSALRRRMPEFEFAACVPFSSGAPLDANRGQERTGVLLRAAAHEAPDDDLLARIEALLGLSSADTLRYADRRLGQRRAARLLRTDESTQLSAVLLAGDTQAEHWIKPLLQGELPAQAYGRRLLMSGARAPVPLPAASPQICTCFNVNQDAIRDTLATCEGDPSQRLAALQQRLRCGTNCGSCLPEVRRLVRASAAFAPA